ncbi:MAG TPA: hypothetical protein VMW43_02860 [Bacteroidota bacterium]|nr:hypothetical protein [Bacteroidota bacterium]
MRNVQTPKARIPRQEEQECRYCEKFILELESDRPIKSIHDLPNTFNRSTGRHEWREAEGLAYAVIPRSFRGAHALIDVYVCLDEDQLDDIDLGPKTEEILNNDLLPAWGHVSTMRLAGPFLSPPADIDCWCAGRKSEPGGR